MKSGVTMKNERYGYLIFEKTNRAAGNRAAGYLFIPPTQYVERIIFNQVIKVANAIA